MAGEGKTYLANRAHTDDPQGHSCWITARDETCLPGVSSGAAFGSRGVSQHGEYEKNGHVGRGFGDGVASVAEPYAIPGHPVDVELVEAGRCGRDDLALGQEGAEQVFIKGFVRRCAHADDEGIDRPGFGDEFGK